MALALRRPAKSSAEPLVPAFDQRIAAAATELADLRRRHVTLAASVQEALIAGAVDGANHDAERLGAELATVDAELAAAERQTELLAAARERVVIDDDRMHLARLTKERTRIGRELVRALGDAEEAARAVDEANNRIIALEAEDRAALALAQDLNARSALGEYVGPEVGSGPLFGVIVGSWIEHLERSIAKCESLGFER